MDWVDRWIMSGRFCCSRAPYNGWLRIIEGLVAANPFFLSSRAGRTD